MATFDSWESYFYAETYNPITQDGTLRNLYGERDAATLHDLEYGAADRRSVELRLGIADVPRTYDAEHIRAIHGYLFQDVYEWAGQFRTVDMGKAWPPELGRGFTEFLAPERIGSYLDDVQQRVAAVPWAELDRDQFGHAAADIFSRCNFAHSAHEGNGRTVKLFMQHVAELSRFELDYNPQRSGITPEVWNRASVLTSSDPGTDRPVPGEMVPVFRALAVDRSAGLKGTQQGPAARTLRDESRGRVSDLIDEKVEELRRASFPTAPTPGVEHSTEARRSTPPMQDRYRGRGR